MKKQILFLMLALLLIGNVLAVDLAQAPSDKPIDKICKNMVDRKEAIEIIKQEYQFPVYEDKVIKVLEIKKDNQVDKMKEVKQYGDALMEYNRAVQTNILASSKTKMNGIEIKQVPVPAKPILTSPPIVEDTKPKTTTIKVPKIETKTEIYIDWLHFRLITKETKTPVTETRIRNIERLRDGYTLNEDGNFYRGDCKQ